MIGKQFSFVQALPLGRSKREQELEQAKVRSHAARAAHRRTKDADRGYQQLIKHLQRPFVANVPVEIISDDVAENHDIHPAATDIRPSHQELVVQKRLTRRNNLGLIPSYMSLRQGNSDPFSAFAVPINSKINALMKYTREFYLPTMSRDDTNPQAVMKPEEWTQCVNLLEDECTAYAHFARVAAFMSQPGRWDKNVTTLLRQSNPWRKSDELTEQALVYNGKGTILLRERIEKGVMDRNTLYVVSCLLAAEMYTQNFEAAKPHVKFLGQFLPKIKSPVDYDLLHNVLRMDLTLAMMFLTRTCLDVDPWVLEIFDAYYSPVLESLPEPFTLAAVSSRHDRSIYNDDRFKDVLVRLIQSIDVYVLSITNPKYSGLEYWRYVRYVVTVTMAIFANRYAEAEEICRSQTTFDAVATGRAQVQAYSSLAALLWCRNSTTESYYGGEKVVSLIEDSMSTRFRETIEESEWMASEVEDAQGGFANTRLWSLYVGAYLEQQQAVRTGSHDSVSTGWFNTRFARQARSMGLTSWEQALGILELFMNPNSAQPNGSLWCQKTLDANAP